MKLYLLLCAILIHGLKVGFPFQVLIIKEIRYLHNGIDVIIVDCCMKASLGNRMI